jgi:hypothetical protein
LHNKSWLSVLVLAACVGAPKPIVKTHSTPVTHDGPPITPLGPMRTHRIQAAYAGLEPALHAWHVDGYGNDCLLTFAEKEEWLIGCPSMSNQAGFMPTGERLRDQSVLWNPESLRVSDKLIPYAKIKLGLVGTVGTHHDDKSGQNNPVLLVQDWDALHRNHPGFTDSHVEEWIGIFVHEAFHAHQMWHPLVQPTIRSLGTVATLDELAAYFKANDAYRAAVQKEFDLLTATLLDPKLDQRRAKAALNKWSKLYAEREKSFAADLDRVMPNKRAWEMEGFFIFLEGTARYVESNFMRAETSPVDALLEGDPSFGHFASSRGKKPSEVPGLSKLGNKPEYAIGMYLSYLLDAADPSWKDHIFDTDGLLVAQVLRSSAVHPDQSTR